MNNTNNPRLVLAFIRHGDYYQRKHTPSALQPFKLTPKGEQQAKAAANKLESYTNTKGLTLHSVIHSSNLLRAWQTATIIQSELSQLQHLETSSLLNERSVGSVANLTLDEISQLLEQDPRYECPKFNWKSNSHYCLPFDGAESLMQSGERLANFIRQLFIELKKTAQKDTLKVVVGHGASFRHAAYLLGSITFDDITRYSMYHGEPVFFEWNTNAQQVNTFTHIAGDWKERSQDKLNQTTQLSQPD